MKNNTWSPAIREDYEQGNSVKGDIFTALGTFLSLISTHEYVFVCFRVGLKIQGGVRQENDDGTETMVAEITRVTPGSVADNNGQLQAGKFVKQ